MHLQVSTHPQDLYLPLAPAPLDWTVPGTHLSNGGMRSSLDVALVLDATFALGLLLPQHLQLTLLGP